MPLTVINDIRTQGTHIAFVDVGVTPSGKTRRFEVRANADNDVLGWVYWFTAWRKYVYHPNPGTVYEEVCMTEIAEFIAEKTDAHKNAPPRSKS